MKPITKKIFKITAIILIILMLLISGAVLWLISFLKSGLGDHWKDYAKAFTMQTKASKDLPPLDYVKNYRTDVRFINKKGTVESRPIQLYIPENIPEPMPLIYVPHYEMSSDSVELRRYLEKGWAVASPSGVKSRHNGLLTDDDLVFNNAALYTLRHMEEFDTQRIALAGGSAGGYTTLMLNALQMGNCASIANSPIANVYFNFYQYFQMANRSDAPFFLRLVRGSFHPVLDNFPNADDIGRWEAFSAVGLANCFGSPFLITHATSDVLVPVDQITREFTYDHEGSSMPDGYSTRLDPNNPGVLGHSLADELPAEQIHVEHIVIDDPDKNFDLPFCADKLFNIDIYDDGPTESYGSHSASAGTGIHDDTLYLEAMFERGLAQNEILTGEKLLLLLERYMGESIQLPPHEGIDDNVYGSLAIYRKEIVEELSCWANKHSVEELNRIGLDAIAGIENKKKKIQYVKEWEQLQNSLIIY